MCEAFKVYFEKIEGLANKELDLAVVKLVAFENRNVALIIAHLAEISRRKAELEHGYRSLCDYGVRRLGLSEGSVALRIQVANVSRRFPQILAVLAEGRISLSVAGRLAPHLREDNVATLLASRAQRGWYRPRQTPLAKSAPPTDRAQVPVGSWHHWAETGFFRQLFVAHGVC